MTKISFVFRIFSGTFGKLLAPIFAIISFIRGFIKTEGTLLDKISGGIAQAIKDFFWIITAPLG
jgi:hypothetical protein